MNTENKKGKRVMTRSGVKLAPVLVVAVLAVVCAVIFFVGGDKPEKDSANQSEQNNGPVKGENGGSADTAIDTPFCTLYYPAKWDDSIRTEQIDLGYSHEVHFYGTSRNEEIELFVVFFGQGSEKADYIGAVLENNIATDVYVEVLPFSENGGMKADDNHRAMQADADKLIGKLKEIPNFQTSGNKEDLIVPDVSDAALETPYCTLYFPGEWKDAVTWDISASDKTCAVSVKESFSGKKEDAFILTFSNEEEDGFQMGILEHKGKEIAVWLTLCDFPQGNTWSDTEQMLFLTLQEQAYAMLEKLAEEYQYTSVLAME